MTTSRAMRTAAFGLLSSGATLIGLCLPGGVANAAPAFVPQVVWCPGQPVPYSTPPVNWDMGVCHDWYSIADPVTQRTRVIEGISPNDPRNNCPPAAQMGPLPCL